VARSADHEALEAARAEIAAVSDAFRAAAHPALTSALQRRLDALIAAREDWWDALEEDVQVAFRETAAGAISSGVEASVERLADHTLWEAPLTAPGVSGGQERGMEGAPTGFVAAVIRRIAGVPTPPAVGNLDDPANRIWVALSVAARPLDPVLEEFGLAPSSPDLGGGHYGLQPRTAAQLDPTGGLSRIWKRYRLAYQRFAALEADLGREG